MLRRQGSRPEENGAEKSSKMNESDGGWDVGDLVVGEIGRCMVEKRWETPRRYQPQRAMASTVVSGVEGRPQR
jgi:hypothetical protein